MAALDWGIHLSWPRKMPCPTWGTSAWYTCPGHVDTEGNPISVCLMCYARGGHYQRPTVKAVRTHHEEDWKSPTWVSRMSRAVAAHTYFRWFDSGDIYHPELAHKIYAVCVATRRTKHWLPTLSYRIPAINEWINQIARLRNVRVRRSSGSVLGQFRPGYHGSTVYRPSDGPPKGTFACPAKQQDDHCADCRACWDKSIKVIAYPARGQQSQRLYNLFDKGQATLK